MNNIELENQIKQEINNLIHEYKVYGMPTEAIVQLVKKYMRYTIIDSEYQKAIL